MPILFSVFVLKLIYQAGAYTQHNKQRKLITCILVFLGTCGYSYFLDPCECRTKILQYYHLLRTLLTLNKNVDKTEQIFVLSIQMS